MKKLILVLISVLIIVGLTGIMVPNFSATAPADAAPQARGETRTVLAEQFTATWCGYCPNAAAGLKQLQNEVGVENFVILAYHISSSDPMATAETDARATAYGVSGIPDVWFDATLRTTGAGSPSSAYDAYKAHYNTRRASESPLKIATGGVIDGTTATVYTQIEKVDTISGSLNIRYVLYENGVSSGDTYNNVVRKMEADTVSSTDFPVSKDKSFTIQSGWNSANLKAAVFVQSGSNGEVYQAKYEDFDGPLNEAPVVSNPTYTAHTIKEDVEDKTLDLYTIFSDPESDSLTFTSDATTTSNVQVTIGTTGIASLLSKENWNGEQDVTFYATDGPFHDPVSHKITITVDPVNDAPVPTDENLDFKMVEDTVNDNINLNDVFTEVDDGDAMTFSVTGNNNLGVTISIDGTAFIDSTGEFHGAEKITFIATDKAGATGTKDVVVTVTGQNDVPIVQNPLADFSIQEDEEDTSIELNSVFLDTDGDTLFFSYEKNKNIGVAIDEDGIVTLTPRKDWNGEETITFKATDKLSPNVKEDVTVTVTPVNDAPVPTVDSIITFDEDVENFYFFEATDVEGDSLTFETNLRTKIKGLEKGKNYFFDESTGELSMTPTNDMVGEYTIQMKVTDDGSPPRESDPVEFTLYIDNMNDIPKNVQIIEPAPGAVFKEGETINFLGSAEDDDLLIPENEEILLYQWRSDKVIGPIGTTEQFSTANLGVGEHKITLTVLDSMNDASSTTVTITIQGETDVAGGGAGGSSPNDVEGSSDDPMSSLWWILVALVVVIVFVLVITMVFMKKKKPELTPEEMQLQSYYDQLQDQGMLADQSAAYGYGYQQPAMMGAGAMGQTAYPQQSMYQQPAAAQTQYPMQPQAQPQASVSVGVAQAPAPAKVVGVLEPKVAEKPQLPPAKEELENLPKTKPVTMNTQNTQSKPKDWNWNY
jgi:thiol-disulfide isomerase/thioredoxin